MTWQSAGAARSVERKACSTSLIRVYRLLHERMALLLAPLGRFRPDLTQEADHEWTRLYLAWNANFIWPSHYCPDMMCFTMLAMPSIALSSPEAFQYRRAHSLFWVVRSTQACIEGH